jgi:ABC-type multidrug transport system ATPase subunit
VQALKHISVEILPGELFGFIGPDGAGKSTLFRIINTLLIPDEGTAKVLDFDTVADYKAIRPRLGYMPGRFSLYQDLSVEENLTFFASVFGTTPEENYDLIRPIYSQLEQFKNRLAGQLSGGMKQKLALSCALIHKPELLLLDEPTTGVDAVSRMEFWEMLHQLKSEGITIVASTPYMDEARQCDRIALIDKGEILRIDRPDAVANSFPKSLYGITATNTYGLLNALKNYSTARSVQPFGESIHYTDKSDEFEADVLKAYLQNHGLAQVNIKPLQPGIEDAFMDLMKEGRHV